MRHRKSIGMFVVLLLMLLTACGSNGPGSSATVLPATTLPASTGSSSADGSRQPDLAGIKTYLVGKTSALKQATTQLKIASDAYYTSAQAANFDYATMWSTNKAQTIEQIMAARTAWMVASPLYEQSEGIVAGTPSLVEYDVNLDAGSSGVEGGESVVTFDIQLPNGRVLAKPGNLFGVTETTLWGTIAEYTIKDVQADFDGDGSITFGEVLPDAVILKGSVDTLARVVGELMAAAAVWQPTEQEAFGALVANIPTVTDFVEAWKNSRFVIGEQGSRDFAAISRLSDIEDNITSWQTIYSGLSPMIAPIDPQADQRIHAGLGDMKSYFADIYTKEQSGRRYSPEDADLIGSEARNRATAIAGEIAQIAAKLNITVKQ